uniref:Uncharacterized protein n=1 Tax=Pan paniscus TaxID=9597 RepID=A0A2R9C108_PANPA
MRHLGLCAQGSSLAWLLQRISLGLTLSLWRVYLVLMPMARTAFKVRRSKSTALEEPGLFGGAPAPPCKH